jgi:serralysin
MLLRLLCRIGFLLLAAIGTSEAVLAADALRIMPLGDSNTRGPYPTDFAGPNPASIGGGGYRYPLQLLLRKAGYKFEFVGSQTSNAVGESDLGKHPPDTWTYDPTFQQNHQGCAGFTSDRLISGGPVPTYPGDPVHDAPPLVECVSEYRPDVVLVMSGTNGLDPANVGASLQALDRLIRTITDNVPKTYVIVSTIFDRWDSPTMATAVKAYNAGIPKFVAAARKQGKRVSFVDAGGVLTRDDFSIGRAYCAGGAVGDGIHPHPAFSMPKVAEVWYAGIKSVVPPPKR